MKKLLLSLSLSVIFLSADLLLPGGRSSFTLLPQTAALSPAKLSLFDVTRIGFYYALPATRVENFTDSSYAYAGGVFQLPQGVLKKSQNLGVNIASEIENHLDGRDANGLKTGNFGSIKETLYVTYSRNIVRRFYAAAKSRLRYHKISDYTRFEVTGGFGFLFKLPKSSFVSFTADHLIRTKSSFSGDQYATPLKFEVDGRFSPVDRLALFSSLSWYSDGELAFEAGTSYAFKSGIDLFFNYKGNSTSTVMTLENRGTLSENYSTSKSLFNFISAGFGYSFAEANRVYYEMLYHHDLGFTHTAGMSFDIKSK